MIPCLNDFIGIKNCGFEPVSGLYINDLPGMSTELADKIASTEQRNFKGVWDSVQKNAQMILKNDIINILREKVNFNNILYQSRKPIKQHPNQVIGAEYKYKGVYVEASQSRYTELVVKGLWLHNASGMTITTDLKIFDVNDGTELLTRSIDIEEGFQYITINETISQTYGEIKVFIAVDCTQLDTLQLYDNSFSLYDCDNKCYCGDKLYMYFGKSNIISNPLFKDLQISNSGSISADLEVQCSINDFVCQNKNHFMQPYYYQLGIQMLLFKLASPKLNYFTASNLENTNVLREELKQMYEKNIKRVTFTIPLTGESLCFNCYDKLLLTIGGMMP